MGSTVEGVGVGIVEGVIDGVMGCGVTVRVVDDPGGRTDPVGAIEVDTDWVVVVVVGAEVGVVDEEVETGTVVEVVVVDDSLLAVVIVMGTVEVGTELVGIVACVVVTKDVDVVGGNSVVVVVEGDG